MLSYLCKGLVENRTHDKDDLEMIFRRRDRRCNPEIYGGGLRKTTEPKKSQIYCHEVLTRRNPR
jgi:hypothetical protein